MQQGGVVGFGLVRQAVGYAIRCADDDVEDHNFGSAAVPAITGRHARIAVGLDLQQAPAAFFHEGTTPVPAGRQVRADVVGVVCFQLKDPCGSGCSHR